MLRRLFPRLGPRKTLTELVHQKLRVDIIRGRFSPGEFISTGKIAEAMGISSMPVRAALTRLETEGLVTIIPQRGVRVSAVSVGELRELFLIRSRLEGLAAHLACPHLTAADFQKLRRLQGEMTRYAKRVDAKAWLTANEQWHHLIIRATKNEQLSRLLIELWHRGMSRRIGAPNVPGHMDRRLVEHEAILAALERSDAEFAPDGLLRYSARLCANQGEEDTRPPHQPGLLADLAAQFSVRFPGAERLSGWSLLPLGALL